MCVACGEREFESENSLLQHCRQAKAHAEEWCNRCEWMFVSESAREVHYRDSNRHWICSLCNIDESEEDDLISHQSAKHSYCYHCEETFGNLSEHRYQFHYRCRTCDGEYGSENDLKMVSLPTINWYSYSPFSHPLQHQQTHLPRDKQCPGCSRNFATDTTILLHLESAGCTIIMTHENIDDLAFSMDQDRHYSAGEIDEFTFNCRLCDLTLDWTFPAC